MNAPDARPADDAGSDWPAAAARSRRLAALAAATVAVLVAPAADAQVWRCPGNVYQSGPCERGRPLDAVDDRTNVLSLGLDDPRTRSRLDEYDARQRELTSRSAPAVTGIGATPAAPPPGQPAAGLPYDGAPYCCGHYGGWYGNHPGWYGGQPGYGLAGPYRGPRFVPGTLPGQTAPSDAGTGRVWANPTGPGAYRGPSDVSWDGSGRMPAAPAPASSPHPAGPRPGLAPVAAPGRGQPPAHGPAATR